jgi:hypothetical protein
MAHLLEYAGPDYLRTLWRGALIIEVALIAELCLGMLMAGAAVLFQALTASGAMGPGNAAIGLIDVQRVAAFSEFFTAAGTSLGLWMLTTRDESEPSDPDRRTRIIIRAALLVTLAVKAGQSLFTLIPGLAGRLGIPMNVATGGMSPTSLTKALSSGMVLLALAGLTALAALVVRYFATMIFFRRLAHRLPDRWLDEWASRMLWLGPLLQTVGLAFCGLGPLIAAGFYLRIVDRVRRGLARCHQIAAAQAPTGPPGPG